LFYEVFMNMRKSYSRIRSIQRSNLILEERYLNQKKSSSNLNYDILLEKSPTPAQPAQPTPSQTFITVNVPVLKVDFAPGNSDSTKFIPAIWTEVKKAIDANPEAKTIFDAKNMALQSLQIYAGASNAYNGKETWYDTENYVVSQPIDFIQKAWGKGGGADDPNNTIISTTNPNAEKDYGSNLNLAKSRGENILTNLKKTISTNGILIPDVTQNQIYSQNVFPAVVNTGGKLDSVNKQKPNYSFPNPGQVAIISLIVSGKGEVKTVPIEVDDLVKGLKDKSVLWGSYHCGDPVSSNCVGKAGDAKYLGAFELKYLPGKGAGQDTYVVPVKRWTFEYDKTGKINKINVIEPLKSMNVVQSIPLNPPGKASIPKDISDLMDAATIFDSSRGYNFG